MLVVRCPVCAAEIMRAELVGYQHAPRLRRHLAVHERGADTFSSRDVLDSFVVEPLPGDDHDE